MKKIFTLLGMALAGVTAAHAQAILGYNVTEGQGTYTPLSSPTVIFDGSTFAGDADDFESIVFSPGGDRTGQDPAPYPGYEIGFDFNFGGETYKNFLVSASGYVYFGNNDVTCYPGMAANMLSYGGDLTFAGFSCSRGVKPNGDTKISYQVMDASGDNARLVVQFENYGLMYGYWGDPAVVDMQVIISKKGKVEVVCNNFSSLADNTAQMYFGLRRGETDMNVHAKGEVGSLVTKRGGTDQVGMTASVPNGYTITYNAPTMCITPSTQPADLQIETTSTDVTGSFTAAEDADTYLVVYTAGDAEVEDPWSGTLYAAGDKIGDNTTVAYFGPETKFALYQQPGGTTYNFAVYATSAYGLHGPQYNIVDPLKLTVSTKPEAPAEVKFTDVTLNTISMDVTSNAAGDDVLVIYNTYCERSMYGDHGLFGALSAETKAGDVLPVPEDFVREWEFDWMPMPENAGTVAYVGKAGKVTIEGLDPSTPYFIGVYTRNAAGQYTSEPIYTGCPTVMQNPYTGDSYQFPRYDLPFGWSSPLDDYGEFIVRNDSYVNFDGSGTMRQGTQPIQQTINIPSPDAINGKDIWLTTPPILVNDRHIMAKFEYCITESAGRFDTHAYNDWAEGDILEIRISEDDGETWTPLETYTPDVHPTQAEQLSYVAIQADLNEYRDKTVRLQLYFKTFTAASWGVKMYIDRFSLAQADFPAVPEVTMNSVTDHSAVASWVSKQNDYELVYSKKDSNIKVTVTVDNAKTYTIDGLEPNTTYVVNVRGAIEDEDTGEVTGWSEWSDPVEFTTANYPEVAAPVNLKSDVETLAGLGYVILSWDKVAEAESYEVAYRLSSATEWTYIESAETSVILTDLEEKQTYVWKVLANCTHDRKTAYSAQARFEAPVATTGIDDVTAEGVEVAARGGAIIINGAGGLDVAVYAIDGSCVAARSAASASERVDAAPGMYVVAVAGKTYKVIVR